MKRFFISVLLLSVYSTIYAQTVVNKYNQAFWNGNAKAYEDKAYEACVSINIRFKVLLFRFILVTKTSNWQPLC